MIRLNVHEAKTHLSRYLKRIQRGETILLCRRNLPIAEIRPLPIAPETRRLGTARGQFTVPPEFFEPLPAELREAFGDPPR
jgi:antitoxin (DNA-binding transcriptional repressor) of toxin-antitoxin stability system